MTEGQAANPRKKRKGMLGFYVGLGVIALLLVGFYFAWTPLRVWYWEREVRREADKVMRSLDDPSVDRYAAMTRMRVAAQKLISIGPRSSVALDRLLRHPAVPMVVFPELREVYPKWALPLLIELARTEEVDLSYDLVETAGAICGEDFRSGLEIVHRRPEGFSVTKWTRDCEDKGRARLLDWWEREGKAQYGRGE